MKKHKSEISRLEYKAIFNKIMADHNNDINLVIFIDGSKNINNTGFAFYQELCYF